MNAVNIGKELSKTGIIPSNAQINLSGLYKREGFEHAASLRNEFVQGKIEELALAEENLNRNFEFAIDGVITSS